MFFFDCYATYERSRTITISVSMPMTSVLMRSIEDWKETTATGVGFAAHANIRTDALEKEIADLKRRIDRIERSH